MPSIKKSKSQGRQAGKKRSGGPGSQEPAAGGARPRAGLPAKDSIVAEKSLKSPKGKVYRILVTDEQDAYDKPEPEKQRPRKP